MRVLPYSEMRKSTWNKFVQTSKNGTFLFQREFMDYHSDRFTDCSLLVYENDIFSVDEREHDHGLDGLKAVFPANWCEEERCVYSHQGLTYGGLVVETEITQTEVLSVLQAVLLYYSSMYQARRVVIKPIPYIYCAYPSGEELYALTRAGAKLESRAVSTTVAMRHQLRMRTLRVRQAKKAIDNDLFIERRQENDWASLHDFWEVLSEVLYERHKTRPVHTEAEIRLLMERFPRNIKLFLVRKANVKVDKTEDELQAEFMQVCEQRRAEGLDLDITPDDLERQKLVSPVVGGCVVFVTNQVAHIQYIAANNEGRSYGALDLLFRHLILQGYTDMEYVDFGISTEHAGRELNEGLIFQKEGFGGRAVCYDTYTIELDRDQLERMTERSPEAERQHIKFLSLKAINDSFEPQLSRAITQVVHSGWYIQGEAVRTFEKNFAAYLGTRFCVGCGNGLEALTLVLRSYKRLLHWHEGDEVIVPANTFIATILAISDSGLKPVLVEPSISDYLIDVESMKAAYTPRTRAVMPVHLYGRVCDMQTIVSWAHDNGLKVIEDAAQVHGATYQGVRAGHLGDAAAFSFYPGKNLGALGDAGCVVTDDEALAKLVRKMGNYGCSEKYVNELRGINSRLDDIQAAVLDVKLKRLDEDNERRRQLAAIYTSHIKNPLVVLPPVCPRPEENVYYIFPIRCPARNALQAYLKSKGIDTLIHYPIPPHKQQAYREWNDQRYPITERIHGEILSLPISPMLTDAQVEYVCEIINEFTSEV